MGLLTDPGSGRGKIPMLLEAHHGKLCLFMYVAGIVSFGLLAHEHFNAGTYFSENALLPGLVESEYDEDHTAKQLLVELKDEWSRFPDSVPYSWLLAKLGQLGLDAYTHNFTLNYPLGYGAKYYGKNIYAVLRAPRGASTEAIVLSAPYRPPSSSHPPTLPGIALLLSLVKYFRRQKYWAKDIIFLLTEHEQLGAQAWLEAYHQASCGQPGVLEHGDLPTRAGSIQAAINLELPSDRLSHVDVKVEGLNGQLPNLDLVNLVHRLCAMESVRHTFKNRDNLHSTSAWKEWRYALNTLLSMVFTQATGMTNGNHGLFHRFGIEAVTIEGFARVSRGSQAGPLMFYQMGRVMEGVCRSLNNLLERFHQSFFFYLLPATDRYISIGSYMPSLGLMCGALLIRSFALWLRMHEEASASAVSSRPKSQQEQKEGEQEEGQKGASEGTKKKTALEANEKDASGSRETKEKQEVEDKTEEKVEEEEEKENEKEKETAVNKPPTHRGPVLLQVGATILAAHAMGVAIHATPGHLTRFGLALLNLPTMDSLWNGTALCALILLGVTSAIARLRCMGGEVALLLNIAGLLELATLLLAVGMHNFSLALFCGTLLTPVALAVNTSCTGRWQVVVRIAWLLLHPLMLVTVAVVVSARATFPNEPLFDMLERVSHGSRQAFMLGVLDSMVYGSWAFPVAAYVLLPTWSLLWIAALAPRGN